MGKIEQARKLTKANRAIMQRLIRIIYCSLPRIALEQILIEVCQQDRELTKYLSDNGWQDVCTPARDKKGDSLASTYSKGDFTRFPWFDERGKLMVKVATIEEIERRINEH